MPIPTPRKVFISHRQQDMARAEELGIALRARGVPVWLDKWDVLPGDDIVGVMEKAISSSEVGLVLLSRTAVGVGWMGEEVAALLRTAVEEGRRIIPVLLDPDAPVPLFLRNRAPVAVDDLDTLLRALDEQREPGSPLEQLPEAAVLAPTCYVIAHNNDLDILAELRPHLLVLERTGRLQFWDPSKIQPNQIAAEERKAALGRAKKAIVLISVNLLVDSELLMDIQTLLEAAAPLYCLHVASAHANLLPISYHDRQTNKKRTRYLTDIKPVNEPENPLRAMSRSARDRIYVKLVNALAR